MNNLQDLEKSLSDMNTGKMATFVLDHMRPLFQLLRDGHLAELKADFRAGKFDSARAQAKLAALCDLDDLEAKLNRQVTRGQKATVNHQGEMNATRD